MPKYKYMTSAIEGPSPEVVAVALIQNAREEEKAGYMGVAGLREICLEVLRQTEQP